MHTFASVLENGAIRMKKIYMLRVWVLLLFVGFGGVAFAQHEAEPAQDHGTDTHEKKFDLTAAALEHVANANAIHIFGDLYLHLPAILYAPDHGWSTFLTSKFEAHHHGNGSKAIDRYVMKHGSIMRVQDESFPYGEIAISGFEKGELEKDGKKVEVVYVLANGHKYLLDKKSTLDGGMLGGGITSYYDFSISKAVVTMFLVGLFLFLMLRKAAKGYAARTGMAPKGVQSFFEPLIELIRDDIAIPFIGKDKYEQFFPYLLSLFFLILGLNLFGGLPLAGNVTGNLSFTLVLAVITALYVNFKGNKHYWSHIFWMPGVPALVKIFILTPVEIMGLIIKPFTLMLRLFANITAGHIVLVCFVGLIFVFGKSGESVGGAAAGGLMAVLLSMFMMAIELLVAFVQAVVFTLLAASYFGSATEEAHH